MFSVNDIIRYPLKSCKGEKLSIASITDKGIQWDRNWALFNENNQVVTGRTQPDLLDIQVHIDQSIVTIKKGVESYVRFPIEVNESNITEAKVFSYEVQGHPVSNEANDFFSEYLNSKVRLLYTGGLRRPVLSKHGGRSGDILSFADQAPILLTTTSSLEDLNKRLASPIGMNRFRPNIVINSPNAYEEEYWKQVKIGECVFEVIQGCERCIFTTIDPLTKAKDPNREPLNTLLKYKKTEKGGANFGVHLVPRVLGNIRVGDELEVLK